MKTKIERKRATRAYGRSDIPVASAVLPGAQNNPSSQSDVPAPQGIARSSASSPEATGTSLLPFSPTYDADGNMTTIQTSTGTWSVSYNAYNRPVTWTKSTGEKIYMMYDAQGRRVEKRVLNAAGVRTLRERYVYVGYTCVQVLNGDNGNAVVKEFAWDPTESVATRPLMFKYVPNGVTLFYAFDGNKNVSDVFCWAVQNGVPAHYEYAPFGAVTRTAKNTPFTLDFVSLNPWRFSSEFCDPELDLVYYNYRHYSPALGRFLSNDPIAEFGGLNLYAFVRNRASFLADWLGLATGLTATSCECPGSQVEWKIPSSFLPVLGGESLAVGASLAASALFPGEDGIQSAVTSVLESALPKENIDLTNFSETGGISVSLTGSISTVYPLSEGFGISGTVTGAVGFQDGRFSGGAAAGISPTTNPANTGGSLGIEIKIPNPPLLPSGSTLTIGGGIEFPGNGASVSIGVTLPVW